jgi:FtsP/CotA-like multicopper oxidase with cupredoxin domain
MARSNFPRIIFAIVLTAGLMSISPPEPSSAQLGIAASFIYNLYATDGYQEMADGNHVYAYGFVGGRAGTDVSYQTSICTMGLDGNRVCATSQVNTILAVNGGVPAPTGGAVQPLEQQFAGNAQFPAPIIYAAVGDVVEIRLKNLGVWANPLAPNDPHSIHLHGLDVDAANDGVPETSVGAVPANLCADGSTNTDCSLNGGPADGAGNVIVYMVTPQHIGTSMYHCHQEADIHVNMGMYGAFVTYNPTDAAYLNGGPGKGFGGWFGTLPGQGFYYDKDYIMLVSEFDVRGHADEEGTYVDDGLVPPQSWDPDPYNWAMYQPQYWFINGLSFPQTIHAGFPSGFAYADWLLSHPGYETLYTGSISSAVNPPGDWVTPGDKVLLRVINMGFETQPLHMHGYHGKIIGNDQRLWDWANKPGNTSPKNPKPPTPFGLGLEKNTLTVGSGETYEWLVDFGQQSFQSTYSAGVETRYYNSLDPNAALCLADLAAAGIVPAEGQPVANTFINCPAPVGTIPGPVVTQDGISQYFPFHNHDDYKATNNGVYPGGMFTMLVPIP